ncbi:MAG TPA: TonB family protein, partial [Gemmatimonadaceae bacterium]|nr:TonB family protein [Gemmatimonadaceae bacterium]
LLTLALAPTAASLPRRLGLFGDAEASTPELPPAPDLEAAPRRARQVSAAGDVDTKTRRRRPSVERAPERDSPAEARVVSPSAPPVPPPTRCAAGEADADRSTTPPRPVRDYAPAFPVELADAGATRGEVVLRFTVDEEGRVDRESATVLRATDPLFARSALEIVEQLRYRPAREEGCAVPATVTRTVRFRAP